MANYMNRELSWLEFNQRVLSEAQRTDLALLERVKFLAISASNLDEFFQVRVGGLTMLHHSGSRKRGIAELTPYQQLTLMRKRAAVMMQDQYTLLTEELMPSLAANDIRFVSEFETLNTEQTLHLAKRFHDSIFPLLTPLSYEEGDLLYHLPSLAIILACQLKDSTGEKRSVFLALPDSLPRFHHVPTDSDETLFIHLETLIASQLETVFPDEEVLAHTCFRLTRNNDIVLQEEDAIDLAGEMEEVLEARHHGVSVRLEIPEDCPNSLRDLIRHCTKSSNKDIYSVKGPLRLNDYFSIAFAPGHDDLREESWEPQRSARIDPHLSVFENIAEGDILLYHPYDSFEPVVRLVEEAAEDPATLAIKQVLYRTAKRSRIIDALIKAAHNGKQVTVLVELKARFDEAHNLQRADELQRAGVQIVYGVKGLKTHSKITLVIRNENGVLKRYCHLGTGNYNESTAKLYTDASYLTCKASYGEDASLFFNAITGRSKLTKLNKLIPAPTQMKQALIERIHSEAERAKQGEEAKILAKVNALQDKDIIDALYRASKAGVNIDLNVRGICCLKVGNRKEAKHIRVVSIIDRYLEHARIFYFHQGGSPEVFIGSADWMTRNLEKRVELLIPIEDSACQKKLIQILEAGFKDNAQAHEILPDGSSQRVSKSIDKDKGNKTAKPFRLQSYLQKQAIKQAQAQAYQRSTTFEPHLPAND